MVAGMKWFHLSEVSDDEKTLEDIVQAAFAQIEEKQYETSLISHGIAPERIHKYGFAFEG